MSAAKRVKLEVVGDSGKSALQQAAEIIVDLGNGLLGRLRTHGPEDATIQEERWQQFKDELYQSEFWQQYKERLDNPDWRISEEAAKDSYNEIVEREIQRAWDESGKGSNVRWKKLLSFSMLGGGSSLPDIPLCDQTANSEEGGVVGNGAPKPCEVTEKTTMSLNGGGSQRYLVTVGYIGSRFLGWQKQNHCPTLRTVQGVLEDAFNKFVGQPVACSGSSRTDTGVHALANVCHVDVERVSKRKPGEVLPPHEPEVVKRAVNHFLQKDGGDVMVVDVRTVQNDFHARFQARERTYHYRILSGGVHRSIFEKDRAWHVPESLNLAAMQEASQVLVGYHDFSSFRAAGCQAKSPVKTLDELHVCEMPAFPCFPTSSERIPYTLSSEATPQEVTGICSPKASDNGCEPDLKRPDLTASKVTETSGSIRECCSAVTPRSPNSPHCYVITARARSFLYHQVRLLVGTIKAVGCGALTVQDVRRILEAKSRKSTPTMAPAGGLYLAEVKYNFETPDSIVTENEQDPCW